MTAKGWSCGKGRRPSHLRGRLGVGARSVKTAVVAVVQAAVAAGVTTVSD